MRPDEDADDNAEVGDKEGIERADEGEAGPGPGAKSCLRELVGAGTNDPVDEERLKAKEAAEAAAEGEAMPIESAGPV